MSLEMSGKQYALLVCSYVAGRYADRTVQSIEKSRGTKRRAAFGRAARSSSIGVLLSSVGVLPIWVEITAYDLG